MRPARVNNSTATWIAALAFAATSSTAATIPQQSTAPKPTPPPAITPTPTPVSRHARVWAHTISAPGVAALAVSDRFIAVAGPESGLSMYAATDGASVWSSKRMTNLPPVLAGDLVAICTDTGLVALRAATGEVAWEGADGAAASAHALVAISDGLLLVTPTGVRAWNLDGTARWHRTMPIAPTRAAAGASALFVSVPGPGIASIDLKSGAVSSVVPSSAEMRYLAVEADRLLVAFVNGRIATYKLTPKLSRDWEYRKIEATGAPAADARSSYATLIDNTLYAFGLGNGHERWSAQLPARPRGGPILSAGRVIVVLADTRLAQFQPDGTVIAGDPSADGSTNIVAVGASAGGRLIAAVGVRNDESRELIGWRQSPAPR